jgi:F0F1-type ATP synthase delta subunit
LSVKETKLIEKIVNTKPNHYISDIMAIMFKRTDLSNTEHFADAHLKQKAKLFRTLKAEVCVPYIVFVTEKIAEYAKANTAEGVEPSKS